MFYGSPRLLTLARGLMTFISISEMAGGMGVVLPGLTGIPPSLTPLAALLALVIPHVRREYPKLDINTILFLLAAFVAYGRFILIP